MTIELADVLTSVNILLTVAVLWLAARTDRLVH